MTKAKIKSSAKLSAKSKTKSKTKSNSKTQIKSSTKAKIKSSAKLSTKSKTKSKTKSNSKTQIKSSTKAKTETKSNNKAKIKSSAKSSTKTKPKTKPTTQTKPAQKTNVTTGQKPHDIVRIPTVRVVERDQYANVWWMPNTNMSSHIEYSTQTGYDPRPVTMKNTKDNVWKNQKDAQEFPYPSTQISVDDHEFGIGADVRDVLAFIRVVCRNKGSKYIADVLLDSGKIDEAISKKKHNESLYDIAKKLYAEYVKTEAESEWDDAFADSK